MNKDCFAYKSDKNCCILKEMICKNKKCSFYKTYEQRKMELEKYPPIDYKSIYENRHKTKVEVIDNG